jgi:phage shock protein G
MVKYATPCKTLRGVLLSEQRLIFGMFLVTIAASFGNSWESTMLELLFVIGFFIMLMVTGVSLLGILAALVVATVVMFVGGLFALTIKLLPWLLLAIAVVWAIRAIKSPKLPTYQRNNRFRY